MKRSIQRNMLACAWLFASLAGFAAAASAQETEPEPKPEVAPEPQKSLPGTLESADQGSDARRELMKLFLEVERSLAKIDDDLADAGAGELPLDAVADSGIDDLLRTTAESSLDIQRKMDRILEIAKEMDQGQGSGSGSGQGKPSPGGDSPLDEARDNGPQQRENTPDAPKPSEGQGEQPQSSDGEEPKDGDQPDQGPGQNQAGDPRAEQPGNPATRGDEADEWGFLPERYREVFRNQGREDLPVQYRDWIDAYYRRLSSSDRTPPRR